MQDKINPIAISGDMIASQLQPKWNVEPPRSKGRPNVLQIILDDTGWSDFGCYGSNIETPNIDSLARQGLEYTNFHVTPLCSPTRASLLTGRNHHSVGMRFLTALDTGYENSRGRVDPEIPMIPHLLKAEGYGTYLVGKWHLVPKNHITPAGPFDHWPLGRGFERFFGFLDGCTDQYMPELFRDNTPCQKTLAHGEHLNDMLADEAVSMIADHTVYRSDAPFYMTFAVGATHAPLQAPKELIEKYVPMFETGWDVERDRRLARQEALGLIPPGTQLTERNPGVEPWDSLSQDQQRLYVRQQATYAAFLEHTDRAIGRLLAILDKLNLRDNTVVMVMSDNGASREGRQDGAVDIHANYSGKPETVADQLKRIETIGTAEGPSHYPEGWAMASNTPFRRYKQLVDLGGVRAPLVISWPKGITEQGGIRTGFAHVIDLAATIAELCEISTEGMQGASLQKSFASETHPARSHQYWEMFGHRAIWKDGWKAVTEHETNADYDSDIWRLYDTNSDFSESTDLSAEHPEKLAELQAQWIIEAKANDVFPLDDRPLALLLNTTRSPLDLTSQPSATFYPENSHIPLATGIANAFRPMRIRAQLIGRRPGQSGALISVGAGHCGYALYIDGDNLVFEHAALGQFEQIVAPVGAGDQEIGLDIIGDNDKRRVALVASGRILAEKPLDGAMRNLSFWGMDIGTARAPSISSHVAASQPMPSDVLNSVTFNFEDDGEALESAKIHSLAD